MIEINVIVNGAKHTIPTTVETEADLLRAVDLDPAGYRLYRDENVKKLGPEQMVGEPGQTHLTSEVSLRPGAKFVAVPKNVTGGG